MALSGLNFMVRCNNQPRVDVRDGGPNRRGTAGLERRGRHRPIVWGNDWNDKKDRGEMGPWP
jgi:hypothetical protein